MSCVPRTSARISGRWSAVSIPAESLRQRMWLSSRPSSRRRFRTTARSTTPCGEYSELVNPLSGQLSAHDAPEPLARASGNVVSGSGLRRSLNVRPVRAPPSLSRRWSTSLGSADQLPRDLRLTAFLAVRFGNTARFICFSVILRPAAGDHCCHLPPRLQARPSRVLHRAVPVRKRALTQERCRLRLGPPSRMATRARRSPGKWTSALHRVLRRKSSVQREGSGR
jgi:hypothetical protein